VCDEGLARFCTEPYQKASTKNFKNANMHLTNYSINKSSAQYNNSSSVESDIFEENKATKRTFTSLFKTLAANNVDVFAIKAQIADICGKTMQIYGPMIEH
jgi:hypothetical protein